MRQALRQRCQKAKPVGRIVGIFFHFRIISIRAVLRLFAQCNQNKTKTTGIYVHSCIRIEPETKCYTVEGCVMGAAPRMLRLAPKRAIPGGISLEQLIGDAAGSLSEVMLTHVRTKILSKLRKWEELSAHSSCIRESVCCFWGSPAQARLRPTCTADTGSVPLNTDGALQRETSAT